MAEGLERVRVSAAELRDMVAAQARAGAAGGAGEAGRGRRRRRGAAVRPFCLASAVPALWVCAGPGAAVVAAVRESGGSATAARGERARSEP